MPTNFGHLYMNRQIISFFPKVKNIAMFFLLAIGCKWVYKVKLWNRVCMNCSNLVIHWIPKISFMTSCNGFLREKRMWDVYSKESGIAESRYCGSSPSQMCEFLGQGPSRLLNCHTRKCWEIWSYGLCCRHSQADATHWWLRRSCEQ